MVHCWQHSEQWPEDSVWLVFHYLQNQCCLEQEHFAVSVCADPFYSKREKGLYKYNLSCKTKTRIKLFNNYSKTWEMTYIYDKKLKSIWFGFTSKFDISHNNCPLKVMKLHLKMIFFLIKASKLKYLKDVTKAI